MKRGLYKIEKSKLTAKDGNRLCPDCPRVGGTTKTAYLISPVHPNLDLESIGGISLGTSLGKLKKYDRGFFVNSDDRMKLIFRGDRQANYE